MIHVESNKKLLDFIGVYWLRKTLIHAICITFFLNVIVFTLEIVCRQSNNVGRRNGVFFAYLEDAAGSFKAVHQGHITIHKDDFVIGFTVFDALLEFLDTLVTRRNNDRFDFELELDQRL